MPAAIAASHTECRFHSATFAADSANKKRAAFGAARFRFKTRFSVLL
jgi:hypothetical protein